jgi:hypothetical protein
MALAGTLATVSPLHHRQGRSGAPVAPRIFIGTPTKRNSATPSAASSSRFKHSMMWIPLSTSRCTCTGISGAGDFSNATVSLPAAKTPRALNHRAAARPGPGSRVSLTNRRASSK